MAHQLERGQQGRGEGGHDIVPRLQPQGAAQVSLAVVHGQTREQETSSLHRQPPVDSERFNCHNENKWSL